MSDYLQILHMPIFYQNLYYKKQNSDLKNIYYAFLTVCTPKNETCYLPFYDKFWKKIPRREVNFLFCSFSCWFQIWNRILNICVMFFFKSTFEKKKPGFYIINYILWNVTLFMRLKFNFKQLLFLHFFWINVSLWRYTVGAHLNFCNFSS